MMSSRRQQAPPSVVGRVMLLCLSQLFTLRIAASDVGGPLACTAWRVLPASSNHLKQLVTTGAVVRKYFISADVTTWSYTPLGLDKCNNFPLPTANANSSAGGPEVRKALLTEYIDGKFMVKRERPPHEQHLGILGPIIRAEEGDFIMVTLRNNLPFPINLEPSGVQLTEPQVALPGATVTYVWAAPKSTDACNTLSSSDTSHMWHYRSTVDVIAHNNAGLFGPIIIVKKGAMDVTTGRPTNIDRELFLVLMRFDDSLIPEGIRDVLPDSLPESARPHAINGFTYCNMPQLTAAFGERVRWYVMGLGNEDDVHAAHWHGITVSRRSQRNVDSLFIVPGVAYTVDSVADNPGVWLVHCHVNHHLSNGMGALFNITGTPYTTAPGPAYKGVTRTYYVQSEVVEWDFAPSGGNRCDSPSSTPTPFTARQALYATTTPTTLGRKVLKAQYIQYTDATFKVPRVRPASEAHLGLQGPTFYAAVGDVIQVVFRNAIKNHNVSIHPHGVLYAKDSEGAPYNDGTPTSLKADDILQYNATVTYRWFVPPRAGPGPSDPSSIMWMYHSHTDEAMDTWAGLFGSIIITRKGSAKANGTPTDVDRHLVLTFSVLDESSSFLLPENVVKYLGQDGSLLDQVNALRTPQLPFIPNGPEAQLGIVLKKVFGGQEAPGADNFVEANKKHSINGYFFCNLPGLAAKVGQRIRIYLQALGDVVDVHSPTLFAGSFKEDGANPVEAVRLLPGLMTTADLVPTIAGSWILQCSVEDHIAAGMRARLVLAGGPKPAAAATMPRARTYYIAAEKSVWDYAPLGQDGCSRLPFNKDQATYTTKYLGSKHVKARYIQYDGPSFKNRIQQPLQQGILGPTIVAEGGQVIDIVFNNSLPFPASLKFLAGFVPVGVVVGGKLQAGPAPALALLDNGVPPGTTVTFRWFVPMASANAFTRHGITAYTYLSGADDTTHTQAGLIGVALVGTPGRFQGQRGTTPLQISGAEFFYPLLFHIFDENQSPFLSETIAMHGLDPSLQKNEDFRESNLKHSINGRLYCNLHALSMPSGQQGIVVVAGSGSENGMHSPIFEGQALEEDGDGTLVPGLLPAVARVVTVTAGARSANWRVYCYVHDHFFAGMVAPVNTTGR